MTQNDFIPQAVGLFKNMGQMQTAVSPDNRILIQQVHKSQYLSAYLLTQSSLPENQQGRSMVALADQIADKFTSDELRALCLELGEDIENLEGGAKTARCLALVEKMRRNGGLSDLTTLVKYKRPNTVWPDAKQIILPKITKKDDLAIVVGSIFRRDANNVLLDVANYLVEKEATPNILLFDSFGKIPLETDWNQFPKIFRKVMDAAFSQTGAKTGHFFLAGVGAILFSMGCMWSTIENSVVYHKQAGTYHPVITLPLR